MSCSSCAECQPSVLRSDQCPGPLHCSPYCLPQQLGSSLGYVALLLDVLSRFLQLPLLHRASFQVQWLGLRGFCWSMQGLAL